VHETIGNVPFKKIEEHGTVQTLKKCSFVCLMLAKCLWPFKMVYRELGRSYPLSDNIFTNGLDLALKSDIYQENRLGRKQDINYQKRLVTKNSPYVLVKSKILQSWRLKCFEKCMYCLNILKNVTQELVLENLNRM